jgi:hypothetical protein
VLDAINEVGEDVNAEKRMYMGMWDRIIQER